MIDFSSLDLARYRRFSERALDAPCAVAVGAYADANFVVDGEVVEVRDFETLKSRTRTTDAYDSMWVEGATTFALRNVEFGAGRESCLLALKVENLNGRGETVPELVHDIARCLEEDYATQETLEGMSEELAARYEELNLVYGIEEDNIDEHIYTTHESIERVITNCRDYLPIDLVGVIVPNDGFCMFKCGGGFSESKADGVLQRLRKSSFLELKARVETMIVNHDDDVDVTETFAAIPYKTVVAPLIGVANQVVGMLVFVNRLQQRDFTTSDRRLADVIASGISKTLQANRDSLTGLYNRKAFETRLEALVKDAHDNARTHGFIYMDLDQFKVLNDTEGHAAGDKFLQQGAAVFQHDAITDWYVARLGGDEFGLLAEDLPVRKAKLFAEAIRRRVRENRFHWFGRTYQITGSFSIVSIDGSQSPAEVMAAADVACQIAKDNGRNQVRCYSHDDDNIAQFHDQLRQASIISEALDENRFLIYGQAITPLQDAADANHYEILVRLKDRNGNLMLPGTFIPAAERYGMITNLDQWVVENAIIAMETLDANPNAPEVTCSINLSGNSIGDQSFLRVVTDSILRSSIAPGRITFEVTETAAIDNLTAALRFMQSVRELGCTFALDDFGVGTSSFGYLRSLPLDYVKIDGSFVQSSTINSVDLAMVRSINEISHLMGLKTVAEYIGNDRTRQLMIENGIDYGQGYEIDKPSLLVDKFRSSS